MEIIASTIIFLVCIVRVVGYGIYTLKSRNKTGAIGLFVLAAVVALMAIPTFMN